MTLLCHSVKKTKTSVCHQHKDETLKQNPVDTSVEAVGVHPNREDWSRLTGRLHRGNADPLPLIVFYVL